MRFAVYESEIGCPSRSSAINEHSQIDANTSVGQHQSHFFQTLSKLGEIVSLKESTTLYEVSAICDCDDVIFAGFHESVPDSISCRFLQHSKGSLMLPGGFLDVWTFNDSTINIVTTHLQSAQVQNGLRDTAPKTEVFVPRIDSNFIDAYEELNEPEALKTRNSKKHIVYAGRWIANKGICQSVRALNIWPLQGAEFTLIGSYERNFPIQWCNSNNSGFPEFFQKECLGRNKFLHVHMHSAMSPRQLRKFYTKADAFIYPSFHEDENFGMAPREAILCGLPAVVSDLSGLGEIGRFQGQYMVKTFPTLAGIRYSLLDLRNQIMHAVTGLPARARTEAAAKIFSECNEINSQKSLLSACEKLLSRKPVAPSFPGWRSQERFNRWAAVAPEAFKRSVSLRNTPLPTGLYHLDHTPSGNGWYCEAHFFQAIQSLYTTFPTSPCVSVGNTYRGFWRVGLDVLSHSIVEYGYPGERRLGLSSRDWNLVEQSAKMLPNDEIEFTCRNDQSVKPLQCLVDMGYLVPDLIPDIVN